MKTAILKSTGGKFSAYLMNPKSETRVRVGTSSTREGVSIIARRSLRALDNAARIETLERKIRHARQHAFGPGNPMARVDAYKAELIQRRSKFPDVAAARLQLALA